MHRWLFLPSSVLKDLEVLARLSSVQFDELGQILCSDVGRRRYAASLQLAEALAIPDEDAAGLYSLWRYVQDERSDNAKSGRDVVNELLVFLNARAANAHEATAPRAAWVGATFEEKRALLEVLFGDFPERDRAKKIERLGLGPIPHFVEFKALCDVRPIYDDRAESIEKNTLVLTLRFVTHGNYDEYNDVSMNIAEDELGVIEEELQRLRRKIALLRNGYPVLVSRKPGHKKRG